jgi:cytidylate kinase
MYRAIALWALRNGTALDDMHRLERLAKEAKLEFTAGDSRILLNGEDVTDSIYAAEVAAAASKVSAVPAVRRALVPVQRGIAATNSVVMEGRDIGTVIFPEAQVKIFLDANPAERARRRALEFEGKDEEQPLDAIRTEMEERDRRDRTRQEAPLMQAPDAELVDTTGMSLEQVEDEILRIIRIRTSNGKEVHR